MTPYRWIVVGWVLLGATVVLGGLSAGLALDALIGGLRPRVQLAIIVGYDPAEFLSGVICGVLAGVTFFSGLACFFWSALLTTRQQLARLLEERR